MLFKIVLGLLVGALLLMLATTTGLRIGLDVAGGLTNQSIRYKHASGRPRGHIKLEGLVYEDKHVKVEIDHADLALMLPSLLIGRLQVRDLSAGEIRLAIKLPSTSLVPSV